MTQIDRKLICPHYIKAILEGTLKEWFDQHTVPGGAIVNTYRNNIGYYSCYPQCAVENNCQAETQLCPIPAACTYICAIEHNCAITSRTKPEKKQQDRVVQSTPSGA